MIKDKAATVRTVINKLYSEFKSSLLAFIHNRYQVSMKEVIGDYWVGAVFIYRH